MPPVAQADAFVATPENIEAQTQRATLASGMKVALLPKSTRGQAVQARLVLHFGDEKSLFGSGEVPEFTAALLDQAARRKLTRQQIEDRFNELQARVSFSGGGGSVSASIVDRARQAAGGDPPRRRAAARIRPSRPRRWKR